MTTVPIDNPTSGTSIRWSPTLQLVVHKPPAISEEGDDVSALEIKQQETTQTQVAPQPEPEPVEPQRPSATTLWIIVIIAIFMVILPIRWFLKED